MKFTGQLEWTDYLNAQLLHMEPKPVIKIINYVSYFILVLVLILGFYMLYLVAVGTWYSSSINSALLTIAIPVFIFLLRPFLRHVILPRRSKKIFMQQKELNVPFEMEITDASVVVSNEFGNAIRPWKNFIKWKENKDGLILYVSDAMFVMLPKRFFSDPQQLEMIKSFIKENGVRAA